MAKNTNKEVDKTAIVKDSQEAVAATETTPTKSRARKASAKPSEISADSENSVTAVAEVSSKRKRATAAKAESESDATAVATGGLNSDTTTDTAVAEVSSKRKRATAAKAESESDATAVAEVSSKRKRATVTKAESESDATAVATGGLNSEITATVDTVAESDVTEVAKADDTLKEGKTKKRTITKPAPVDESEETEEVIEQLALDLNEPGSIKSVELPKSYLDIDDDKPENVLKYIYRSFKSKMNDRKERKAKKKKKKFNPIPSVHATRYHPDPKVGLNETQIEERYENDLCNKVENKYSKTYRSIFFGNIFTFFNLLGLLCAIALLVSKANLMQFFFCVIYFLNIVIGIIQEIRAKRSIEKLSLMSSRSAKVIRNSVESEIYTNEIVLDDILHYNIGNQISTDSVIEEGTLEVNESLLTGESVSVKKTVGDMLFAGSFVTGGNCYARANKVGKENYIEVLSAKAKKYKKPHSELMQSSKLIISIVGFLIVPIAIGMFFKLMATSGDWSPVIQRTVAVVIGMIPSGMMLLTSMALAVGVVRMAKNNTLIQDLYSLEMLARIDTLCLDKTGTITDGRMKVNDCIILNNNVPNTISEIMGSMLSALDDNNQTSIALNNHFGRNNTLKPIKVLPFNSNRKLSAVTFAESGTYAFGAPEFVLKEIPDNISRMIKQYASMGLRVMLLCYSKASISGEHLPLSMKAVALITITDNIREDAVSTIEWFKENGVQIKIISGDNPITVSEVARRVGVDNAHRYISLEGLSESDVINVANKYTVFGRVSPEQKAILIRAIKAAGHCTAMTGDGVNDILALKEANCAISVGSGSDAARNVSHIVLRDSNFASMPKVVHEGRRVINNIQNTASLYLMKTIFITLLAICIIVIPGAIYPFTTENMLLLEFFVIGFTSFFLSLQPNDSKVEGKFINYVISKSLPGALLMLISVLIIQIIQIPLQNFYGAEIYTTKVYTTMQVLTMTFCGMIMLYRICKPFNIYRGVLCAITILVIVVIALISVIQGFELFGLVKLSPLKTYWHHILIVVSLIIMSVPLASWLESLTEQIRMSPDKNKKRFK